MVHQSNVLTLWKMTMAVIRLGPTRVGRVARGSEEIQPGRPCYWLGLAQPTLNKVETK